MARKGRYNTGSLYLSGRMTTALDAILDHPLTIIEAPLGYGKTTSVREYLRNAGVDVLWQRVYDDSTAGFWTGFAGLFGEGFRISPGSVSSLDWGRLLLSERDTKALCSTR